MFICVDMQAALSEAGHQYTELNVGLDSGLRAAVREAAGKTSVPQVSHGIFDWSNKQ
jgi:glutaredoxin